MAAKERTFTIRGTPEYMAPEMLKKTGYSYHVDWWALGTLIYEMLVGLAPFFDEDENKMYAKIIKSKLSFPRDVKISKDCIDLLEKLL